MKSLFLTTVTTVFLAFGMLAFGQQRPATPGAPPTPEAQAPAPGAQTPADTMTLTGCLSKGTEPNQYQITDQSSRQTVAFPGPNQLAQYVNQTVKLTGKMVDNGQGQKTFQPNSINPVSSSCK